jgi:DNA-directed RNA polymerase subunit RPC12/RpoP
MMKRTFKNRTIIKDEDLTSPEQTQETIYKILLEAFEHYRCLKCGSPLGKVVEIDHDTNVIRCEICGHDSDLKMPVYLNESHDKVIGYQYSCQTGNPKRPFNFHYIGFTPSEADNN